MLNEIEEIIMQDIQNNDHEITKDLLTGTVKSHKCSI